MLNKYLIRFNKTRGMPGRGTIDHTWRVFEGDKEFLVKHVNILVPSWDEVSTVANGHDDWNIACIGHMVLDRETSTAVIHPYEPTKNVELPTETVSKHEA